MNSWFKMLNIVCFVLLIAFGNTISGQAWNSARLSILSGGNIPFNFNSLERFKNGITITDGTKLGISLATNNITGHDLTGFILNFRSFNNQTVLQGDSYTLPLSTIRVVAGNAIGLESGHSEGRQDLSADWTALFTYENLSWTDLTWTNDQLNISYDCGISVSAGGNGSLLGEEPDYYQVEIEFELIPTGSGF
ncbi:MAG: hypothetical protein PHH37_07015 [Paludibacter sp.]|nr:hypothetical protein [Paludibacter sp.]